MKATYKQIFDINSAAVEIGGQKFNVFLELMTAKGLPTAAGYRLRVIRKAIKEAIDLFIEQRDDILKEHNVAISEAGNLVDGDDDAVKPDVPGAVAAINDLLDVEVDSVPSVKISELEKATGRAQEILIEWDALSLLDPVIKNDM